MIYGDSEGLARLSIKCHFKSDQYAVKWKVCFLMSTRRWLVALAMKVHYVVLEGGRVKQNLNASAKVSVCFLFQFWSVYEFFLQS